MEVYIDFDGTVFDTDRQFEDFKKVCNNYGVTASDFDKANKEILRKNKIFNIEKVIKYLIDKYSISNEIYKDIDALFNDSYVFEDVLNVLIQLKRQGYKLYLLTYGDYNFQKRKIDSTTLGRYFIETIITCSNKSELGIDRSNSIFIDNNPEVLINLYNAGYTVVRIRRTTDKYSSLNTNISEIIECESFEQVVELMKGNVENG